MQVSLPLATMHIFVLMKIGGHKFAFDSLQYAKLIYIYKHIPVIKANSCMYLGLLPTKSYSPLATNKGSVEWARTPSSGKSSYLFRGIGLFCEGMKLSACLLLFMSCSSCNDFEDESPTNGV